MKIIRNHTCYVELEDIEYLNNLSNKIFLQTRSNVFHSPFFNFIKFDNDDLINFFQQRKDIIDYDVISKYSILELNEKIDELNRLSIDNNSSNHVLESLIRYVENKELYDDEIAKLTFKSIKKVPLKYMSAITEIQPVSAIPVSSSKIEKLNLEIRKKCEQNAYERQKGEEFASKYLVKSRINKR